MQGDDLSPLLFALFIADFCEYLVDSGITGISQNNLMELLLLAHTYDVMVTDTANG